MKYSPATNGFYLYPLQASATPPDAVDISDEEYAALRLGQSSGKTIVPGGDGRPFLTTMPAIPHSVSSLQFMDRFTEVEQLAIVTATMSVAQVKLWYDRMLCAEEIVYKDARTLAGLQALVAAGLITQARMDEVLPPEWR
ncbi:MAG: hypothetical protein WBK19_10585 [Azonexus sp.]